MKQREFNEIIWQHFKPMSWKVRYFIEHNDRTSFMDMTEDEADTFRCENNILYEQVGNYFRRRRNEG